MYFESVISDYDKDMIEKVVVEQEDPIPGMVTPTAFLTIIDDGGNQAVFHYRQVDDILWALNDIKQQVGEKP